MVLLLGGTLPIVATAADQKKTTGTTAVKPQGPKFDRYQVAAGTALLVKLRTPLSSATATLDEQVEAVLWSPVVQDGIELVPVGSVVLGRVVEIVRASEKTPTGSLTFAFTIIEHGETGSREALASRKITIEAQQPEAGRGRGKKKFELVDLSIPSGTPLVAMTAEPLAVRIPR